ncbi:MAG: hypothetical protein WD934_06575 [Gemmatimonadales bacterium]
MVVKAPEQFEHAGQREARLPKHDPRTAQAGDDVIVDLRACSWVRPPAALWCLIFGRLTLASGVPFTLLVPDNIGVATYLQAIGLFDLLKEAGANVDDRGVGKGSQGQIGVPLTKIASERDVEDVTNLALEQLEARQLGAPNRRGTVAEAFAELGMNAVQHSESAVGAFGMIQYYDLGSGPRFACVVADGGVGIMASLERNPALQGKVFYDWDAIAMAMQERVSGTADPTRGIGLYAIAEELRRPKHHLLIHSGIGLVSQSEELEADARRTPLFPGTLAYATLPA